MRQKPANHGRPRTVAPCRVRQVGNSGVGYLLVVLLLPRIAGTGGLKALTRSGTSADGRIPIGKAGSHLARAHFGMDALSKAMHLIGSADAHATAERGLVARRIQPVRPGWFGQRQRTGVVPGVDGVHRQSGQEGGTRRHAQRRRAVGVLECNPAIGQALDRRGLDEGMAVGRADNGVVLVAHEHQHVGTRRDRQTGLRRIGTARGRRLWGCGGRGGELVAGAAHSAYTSASLGRDDRVVVLANQAAVPAASAEANAEQQYSRCQAPARAESACRPKGGRGSCLQGLCFSREASTAWADRHALSHSIQRSGSARPRANIGIEAAPG